MTLSALHADIAARYDRLNQSIAKGAIKPAQAAVLGEQYAYPVSKDALGIARAGAVQTGGIDATEHSVSFIISTQEEDRDGDIVVSRGGELAAYSRNPVVLFGHGSWQIPIGTAKDPNGQLAVWCDESRVRAKCFFDMPDPDAAFIYGKVERGILNATSISFLPVQARRREYEKSHHEDQKPLGWIFDRWEMTEFSIVAIPANAGAIRDSLDSEKSFMSPKLQKALSPFAAIAKGRCFSGYCPCPPCEDKAFDEADHPRGQPDNAGQFGPASGLPGDSASGAASDESAAQSYVDAFTGSEKVTLAEVKQANQELADDDSEYRVIPDDQGGWQIFSAADLASEFGEDWAVRQDVNGKWDVVNGDDFTEPEGTPDVRGYSDVFDEDPAGVTEDELDQVNQELEDDDSDWRIWPNPANGRWEPVYLEALVHEYGENYRIRIGDNGWEVLPGGSKTFRRGKDKSFLAKFIESQRGKTMSTKLNAATLTSGLPGKKCHKSTCKCKKCKKALPEETNATPGSEAAGVHEDRNEGQEHEAEHQKAELQAGVDAKMPKLIECGYEPAQAMCLAAHLHGKGLEGDDITGHEEAAKALGYKSKDDMGGDSGAGGGYSEGGEEMSLKSFVKAMKEENEEEDSAKPAAAEDEKPAEGETEETENGEAEEQYKPSQKMLGHMHNHMKNAHGYLSKELPLMDHEKIAKALTAHCKDLEGHMENYKELASTNHGMSSGAFDKMCKSLEGGETETEENETGANSEGEATGAEDHGSTEESGQELIREYQHPKGVGTETMKSLAGTLGRIKGFTDQKSEEWFRISGQRI